MIKKLYGLLIIFVCMFMFSGEVWAATDHSLNYDIESFKIENNKLVIKGWAFIHNYDNYGGMEDGSQTISWSTNNGTKSKTISSTAAKLNVYFFFDDGSNILEFKNGSETLVSQVNVTFHDSDFTEILCVKSGDVCWSDDTTYVYKNVRFSATIHLDDLKTRMGNSTWNLKIGADLGITDTKHIDESLAVDTSVAVNSMDGDFEISGLEETVDVTGNHVGVRDQNYNNVPEITYWKLTAGDDSSEYYGSRDCSNSGDVCYYLLYYREGGSTGRNFSNYESVCGFENDDSDYEIIDGESLPKNLICTNVCGTKFGNYLNVSGCSRGKIKSVFVKPTGSVQIKYINNDKYCSLTNSDADNCDGSLSYSCNAMTVKYTSGSNEYKANVSVTESAKWEQGEFDESGNFVSNKPFTKTIVAGKGFKYGIRYTDTVVIKLDTTSRNYHGDTYDNNILNTATGYYSGLTTGKFNVVDAISPWDYEDEEFSTAGVWDCSSSSTSTVGKTVTITQTCDYKLKIAGIEYKGANGYPAVSYFDSSVPNTHKDGGNYYYVPLDYGENKFNWDFDFTDLGTYKFIIDDSGTKEFLSWSIVSSSSTVDTCYVNVEKTNNTGEGAECVGAGCAPEEEGGGSGYYLPVYRSIDHMNPFPGYITYPENWEVYDPEHAYTRVKNSYNGYPDSPVYQTKKEIKNANFGSDSYTSFNDITAPAGTADIVDSGGDFDIVTRNHCEWGEWKEECDT